MSTITKEYVETYDGAYFITGKRISLDSIVYSFKRGASPESIQRSFPLLSLEEVYGAIAFYLSHQLEIDTYLKNSEREFDRQREMDRATSPEFYARFDEARATRT